MSYDDEFYGHYSKYLVESRVRAVHDKELAKVKDDPAFRRVLDLGCGRGNEYFHYAKPDFYLGIDLHPIYFCEKRGFTTQGDYRTCMSWLKWSIDCYHISAVVSLFSMECTARTDKNRKFYKELFEDTKIEAVLSVGFHYPESGCTLVQEKPGIISYQTWDEPFYKKKQIPWTETRTLVECPSEMFGDTPVEVWRVLRRA